MASLGIQLSKSSVMVISVLTTKDPGVQVRKFFSSSCCCIGGARAREMNDLKMKGSQGYTRDKGCVTQQSTMIVLHWSAKICEDMIVDSS